MVCDTCTCTGRTPHGPDCSEPRSRLLLSTPFAHLSGAVDEVAHDLDLTVRSVADTLWELHGERLDEAVSALRRSMSVAEAAQSRVLIGVDTGNDAALVVAAMSAPTLDQLDAQLHGAQLSRLFDHEHAAFRSAYQPIVALDSRELVAFEALLRARTPDGEELTPGPLFEHAQRAGWSARLDRIGRTSALHGAAGWLTDRSLFINFIPTSIYDPKVCLVTTERAADRAGISLEQIVFEVTESERVADVDHLQRVFDYYRERGCRVALDDLGAGYSSLSLLLRLQPDVVKLDRTLVEQLGEPTTVAVVRAVVDITHAYGGLVLAEGVETENQAASALELGLDLGQGWLFGRPAYPAGDPLLAGQVGAAEAVAGALV